MQCPMMERGKKVGIHDTTVPQLLLTCSLDCKVFDAVSSLNLYGAGNKTIKEDCINHVAQRMGTALMNIISESKVQKDSIDGKGKLTKAKIKKDSKLLW